MKTNKTKVRTEISYFYFTLHLFKSNRLNVSVDDGLVPDISGLDLAINEMK